MILHVVDKDLAKIFLDFSRAIFLGSLTCDYFCGYTIPLLNVSNESASWEYFVSFQGEVSALGVIFEAVFLQAVHIPPVACELAGPRALSELVPRKVAL